MIKRQIRKARCNRCGNDETYSIEVVKRKNTTRIILCKDCMVELYFELAKIITPKSPRNFLNKFNK